MKKEEKNAFQMDNEGRSGIMGNWGDEMSGSIKVHLNVEVEVVGPAHSPAHAALDAVNRFGAKGRDGGLWKNTHAEENRKALAGTDIDVDYSELDTSMISDEAAERRVELGPLLGGGPSKHRQTIDADDQVTSTRCQFWRRCSLLQLLVAFGILFAFVFLCIFPSSWDPFLRVFMATLHYWLLIGLMMGLLWCCIRSRAAREQQRPDSNSVSQHVSASRRYQFFRDMLVRRRRPKGGAPWQARESYRRF